MANIQNFFSLLNTAYLACVANDVSDMPKHFRKWLLDHKSDIAPSDYQLLCSLGLKTKRFMPAFCDYLIKMNQRQQTAVICMGKDFDTWMSIFRQRLTEHGGYYLEAYSEGQIETLDWQQYINAGIVALLDENERQNDEYAAVRILVKHQSGLKHLISLFESTGLEGKLFNVPENEYVYHFTFFDPNDSEMNHALVAAELPLIAQHLLDSE